RPRVTGLGSAPSRPAPHLTRKGHWSGTHGRVEPPPVGGSRRVQGTVIAQGGTYSTVRLPVYVGPHPCARARPPVRHEWGLAGRVCLVVLGRRLASRAWCSRGRTRVGRSPTQRSGSSVRPPSSVTGGTGPAWASGMCAPWSATPAVPC